MNIFCLIFPILTIILVILYWRRSLVYVIESTISLIIGFFLALLSFGFVFTFLEQNGIRENVYSPSIIFLFLVTIFWGVLLTAFVSMINFGEIIGNVKTKYFSILFGMIVGFMIAVLGCLILHPFLRNESLSEKLSQCFVCQIVQNNLYVREMTEKIGQVTSDVFSPSTPTDVYLLNEEYKEFDNSSNFRQTIFEMINSQRESEELEPLYLDKDLNDFAKQYATEINTSNLLSHYDQEMRDAKERAILNKIKFDYIGENLAIAPSIGSAHEAFMKSETHRDNILSPVFKKVGVAVFRSSKGNLLIVQQFTN